MSNNYQEYAKKFNRQLHSISGLIIYDTTYPIPPSVVIIPCDIRPGQDLNTLVREQLLNNKTEGILVYFQGIRWIMPDLEEPLKQWTFVNAEAVDGYFNKASLKISYGKVTYDNSNADLEEGDDVKRLFILNVFGTDVRLKITEFPKEVGPAKLFEKINL
ncbi:hypothetical protein SAMN05518672_106189 [Chitinophaga sp. CF118]|uniref:hypothetical protein n=1 Tax=Chitinophaga sp. CF118 TaxID=1884367 RepID=UPI0008F108F7|nr:hypothetical protein [Chitinophaga sp. CF118]SFE45684.1 hypothetical protein SAMN05518672_106189 [Chitinophaga sp. CF118]